MIIKCAECCHSVSDKAAICPQCGAPVATSSVVNSIGVPLATTQLTSKHLKLQSVIFGLAVIFLVFLLFIQVGMSDGHASSVLVVLLWIAFIGFVVTRIRIWWHHS